MCKFTRECLHRLIGNISAKVITAISLYLIWNRSIFAIKYAQYEIENNFWSESWIRNSDKKSTQKCLKLYCTANFKIFLQFFRHFKKNNSNNNVQNHTFSFIRTFDTARSNSGHWLLRKWSYLPWSLHLTSHENFGGTHQNTILSKIHRSKIQKNQARKERKLSDFY